MIPFKTAHEQLVGQESAYVKELEATIDRGIQDYKGASISVPVGQYPDAVVAEIKKKYEAGGWSVHVDKGDDQREQSSWHNLIVGPPRVPEPDWPDRYR